jgi:hypothetical protein
LLPSRAAATSRSNRPSLSSPAVSGGRCGRRANHEDHRENADGGTFEQRHTAVSPPGGRLRAAWHAVLGALGTLVGLAPHVLHHIGLLAGTALVAGAAGTTFFGLLGLVAAIPLLLRLKRRFGSWWAPAIGLAVFVAMFCSPRSSLGRPSVTATAHPPTRRRRALPATANTIPKLPHGRGAGWRSLPTDQSGRVCWYWALAGRIGVSSTSPACIVVRCPSTHTSIGAALHIRSRNLASRGVSSTFTCRPL